MAAAHDHALIIPPGRSSRPKVNQERALHRSHPWRDSISQADSLEKMGEFWDTHDFTQFDTDAPDVEFTISSRVSIEPELLAAGEQQARLRGVGMETLVNLWLQEKLSEQAHFVAARYSVVSCDQE